MNAAFAMTGANIADRWGRRKMLIFCYSALVFIWIGVCADSGVVAQSGLKSAAIAGIFFYWLARAIYALCFTPLQALYPAEILSYEQRAKGMAFSSSFANNAALMVNQSWTPVAMAKIGGNFFLFMVHPLFCFPKDQRVHSGRT